MIKNIIFDVGGVLLYPANKRFKERLSKASGLAVSKILEILLKNNPPIDKGTVTYAEFSRRMGRDLGIPASSVDWMEPLRYFVVKKSMIALARRACKTYTTAYISNVDKPRYRLAIKIISTIPFAFSFPSCYLGMVKPYPAIYKYALRHMKAKAQETVFIDDVPANVVGARKVGIHAIHFTTEKALKKDLKRLGVKL